MSSLADKHDGKAPAEQCLVVGHQDPDRPGARACTWSWPGPALLLVLVLELGLVLGLECPCVRQNQERSYPCFNRGRHGLNRGRQARRLDGHHRNIPICPMRPRRLTWSLSPHSPAAALSGPVRRLEAQRHQLPACRHLYPGPTAGPSAAGLTLSRIMLGNHGLPYLGRFACGWLRLATTDPPRPRRQSYCLYRPGGPDPVKQDRRN